MHELAAVESLVDSLLKRVEKAPARRVKSIRIRLGGGVTEESVRQGFDACVMGTALEHAVLKVEELVRPIQCGCGHRHTLNVTEQDGYPYVCPECGDMVEVDPGPDLEVLEVIYENTAQETSC